MFQRSGLVELQSVSKSWSLGFALAALEITPTLPRAL